MRTWLILLLTSLLALQSVQAACLPDCHRQVTDDAARSASSVAFHAQGAVQGLHDAGLHDAESHALGLHGPASHVHPSAAADDDVTVHVLAAHGHGDCKHGDAGDCCHATVPLPSRHAFVAEPPGARPEHLPVRLPALSHASGGPFRPPRLPLA